MCALADTFAYVADSLLDLADSSCGVADCSRHMADSLPDLSDSTRALRIPIPNARSATN